MGQPLMFEDRKGYAIAERKAAAEVALIDPALVASERAVSFDEDSGVFTIPFLGGRVHVSWPSGEVSSEDDARLSGAAAILALHYLVYRGEPLRRQGWLAFRDMPAARHFTPAFEDMSERLIAQRFGERPEAFLEAAEALGGTPAVEGDASTVLPAFPRVPLLLVLWTAGEAIKGSARILFKPSAPFYFHSEDLAALGALAAERLIAVNGRSAGTI